MPQQRRWFLFTAITAFIACDQGDDSPYVQPGNLARSADEQSSLSELDELYEHPLLGASGPDGAIPFADLKDSPRGLRYGIEETLGVDQTDIASASGIVEYAYGEMTDAEQVHLAALKDVPGAPGRPSKIGPELATALLETPTESPMILNVSVKVAETEPLAISIHKEVARGNIVTRRDAQRVRTGLLEARQAAVEEVQDRVVAEVVALGGTILGRCELLACMTIQLDAAQVMTLAALPSIMSVNIDVGGTRDADVTGTQVVQGSQIKQFIDAGYDGEYSTNTDIPFAIIEFDDYYDEHLVFKDTSAAGARILSRRTCTAATCTSIANFPTPPQVPIDNVHATASLALIMGDLRDAQDPGQATTAARVDRSGYAGESWGHLYRTALSAGGIQKALSNALMINPRVHVVNMSVSASEDATCTGATPLGVAVNQAYQLGTLVFKSAGNTGHANVSDCTVGSPGAAIGAFTVGAHGSSVVGTESSVRTASIWSGSARGGAGIEGGPRSIIDLTAFGARALLPWLAATNNYSTIVDPATSFATPTVMAGAIDFIDFYKRVNMSNFIDDPGVLFANMLLMGDRQGASGKLITGFDNLYGAGRLKMRLPTAAGLDSPAIWKVGSTCVDDGSTVTIPVNSGIALNPTVNDFKAVAFWYDRNQATTGNTDDVDLELYTVGGVTPLRSSASAFDNKERVYHSAIGGNAVELRIHGYNVAADLEGCGTDSQAVYWAYFYEDDKRDDPEIPTLAAIDRE